jgi:hypothetical protein
MSMMARETNIYTHTVKRQKERRTDPFAFIHVSLVTNQYLVDIVRSMLLNVTNPIPNV